MADDTVIRAEGLGKKYVIGHEAERERYVALRDVIARGARNAWRMAADMAKGRVVVPGDTVEEFWALKGVSFEVKRGEVLGIIGRNGAGKSTLLKILSRITELTEGRVTIKGRVASLLEVGTGFHPELTGRENIFLNGAVLGMTRAEIKRKFDEIVAFAEVEKFLDTPVKRYSSGMYVRLAFAVAAHLEPEILIVDEVLAVGDAQFQKKCLGKMHDVSSKEGRTVLFVSHNMAAITRLCRRALLLQAGEVMADGDAQVIASTYSDEVTKLHATTGECFWPDPTIAPGDSTVRLRAVRVLDRDQKVTNVIEIRDAVTIEIEYYNLTSGPKPTAIVHFINEDGVCLFASNDFNNLDWWNSPRRQGLVCARCQLPGNFFAEGRINILAAIGSYNPNIVHAKVPDAVSFLVFDKSDGDGVRGSYVGTWPGLLRPKLNWEIKYIGDDTPVAV